MRILNKTEYVTACNDCMVEIGYYDYEVEQEILPPYMGPKQRYFIRCPLCKKAVIVGEKEPKLIYSRFNERND